MCQQAGLNVENVVQQRLKNLLSIIRLDQPLASAVRSQLGPSGHALYTKQSDSFAAAAHAAESTLCVIAPDLAVPKLVEQVLQDLDESHVKKIDPTHLKIWAHPSDQVFVDVLDLSKNPAITNGQRSGKEREILKWEHELRESLARKKSSQPALTKMERDLLDVQLKKETGIRENVSVILARLRRGFGTLPALLMQPVSLLPKLEQVVEAVLNISVNPIGELIAAHGFQAFLVSVVTNAMAEAELSVDPIYLLL